MRDGSPCHAVRCPSCVCYQSVCEILSQSPRPSELLAADSGKPLHCSDWNCLFWHLLMHAGVIAGMAACSLLAGEICLCNCCHLQSRGFLTLPLEQMESSRSSAECGLSYFSFRSESSFHLGLLLANDFLTLLKTLPFVPLWLNKMASFNTSIEVNIFEHPTNIAYKLWWTSRVWRNVFRGTGWCAKFGTTEPESGEVRVGAQVLCAGQWASSNFYDLCCCMVG